MPSQNRLILALAFCGALASSPAFSEQKDNIVSFHGKDLGDSDFTNALTGGKPAAKAKPAVAPLGVKLPEGFKDDTGPLERGVRASTVPTGQRPVTPVSTGPVPVPDSAATPPAQAQPAQVQPEPGCPVQSNVVSIDLTFEVNSSELASRVRQNLTKVAKEMTLPTLQKCRFQVEGHTDSTGTPKHNQALSEQRADAVRNFLIEQGVEGDRLFAVGKGQRYPINTRDKRAEENRRVQFRIEH